MVETRVWNNVSWERDLRFNEVILNNVDTLFLYELMQILWDAKPNIQEKDRFVWWRHKHGFLFKDSYKRILEISNMGNLVDHFMIKTLFGLLKTKVPRKILIFGWQLIINKFPKRIELSKWNYQWCS